MSEVLRLDDVTLRRGDNQVLDGISWSVEPADRWVILGPNGAGKTSLMTVCSARAHPTTGTAHILGQQLGETDTHELRIRVGLASAALADRIPPDETVHDIVMTAAHGVTGRWREEYEHVDEVRAEDLLAAFGMHAFAHRTFETLSEGERKRVQIARALMTDPELLLLDEPAAGLDLGGREELLSALTELAGDKRSPAMVMVTHHVEEVPEGFTHALLLRDGKVVAQGRLADTLTSANLSETYGIPIQLFAQDGRWTARRSG
ncbi:ABC transporter ATP-binding protein [Demequina sp. TTPB684]|uniref:ABC transporter ATP-binding protein n=1 Tax=unclassified Demequina TaxID=2620311 RepID=UPI001CF4E2E0|nr:MULTISPECIES: ABC transporter ATP-binding protein [unclassified Demequina]MCB2413900.1 ABC transporter ATP-binding protein [Demequina sp. TTPB684]UPU89412.1 ABC transporter ATP-binding protein [Demequina sp. TMPB413]